MWPEPRDNGTVRFVERYKDPMTGKTGKVTVTMPKDTSAYRKKARAVLDDKIADRLDVSDHKEYTLQELVDAYLAEQGKTVKASTARRNSFSADKMLEILGPNTLVSKLNAKYIRDRFYALDEPNSTINERLKRTKVILRWGYKNDYLSDISFLDKVSPLPDVTYREKIEDKFLETDEFLKLVDGMEVTKWKLLTEFLGLSGLRIGEAVALKNEDVDIAHRVISVSKTYDPNNNVETKPKTSSSWREVYMQDELLRVCRQIKTEMKKQALEYGYKSDYFFQSDDGSRMKYYAYSKYIKKNAQRILGRNKVTPHILRHTHTCILAENGVPLETITRRLGHEDSSITKSIYLHVTKKMKLTDNERIDAVKVM